MFSSGKYKEIVKKPFLTSLSSRALYSMFFRASSTPYPPRFNGPPDPVHAHLSASFSQPDERTGRTMYLIYPCQNQKAYKWTLEEYIDTIVSYRDQHQKLLYEPLSKISPKAMALLLLNWIFLNCIQMKSPIYMYLRFCLHLCRHQPEEYEASQSMESQLPHKGWLQIHHPQIQDRHGRSQKPQAAPFPCQNCKEKQVSIFY